MQENIITKSFEHLQIQKLPKKVHKIISSVARRHGHVSGDKITTKQIELASALLRMKLYQAFGPVSNEYIEPAVRSLIDSLQDAGKSNSTVHTTVA